MDRREKVSSEVSGLDQLDGPGVERGIVIKKKSELRLSIREPFLKWQCMFGEEWGKVMNSEWNALLWIT